MTSAATSVETDLVVFTRLVVGSLPRAKKGKRFGVLIPEGKNSSAGISCLDMQLRMRMYHRVAWTYERVRDVVEELARRGVVQLTAKGYRLADVDAATAIAKGAS